MKRITVGLDYHKDSVQVAVLDAAGKVLLNRRCENDWRSIRDRVERLGVVGRGAIEACCGASDLAEELNRFAGWRLELAHPGYVARMKRSPDKTDFNDARLLADLARVNYVPGVWLAPENIRQLRSMVRHRAALVHERTRHKQRIGALLREYRVGCHLNAWTKVWLAWLPTAPVAEPIRWILEEHLAHIAFLTGRIARVEAKLDSMTADDPIVHRLMTFKGIGHVTAWVIRAEIGQFGRFKTGKQVARFCGLSPRNASSGARQADAGLIRAGSTLLRSTLIEAAHRLKRYDERWKQLAARLRSRGKSGPEIAAAVANRWVRSIHHVMA